MSQAEKGIPVFVPSSFPCLPTTRLSATEALAEFWHLLFFSFSSYQSWVQRDSSMSLLETNNIHLIWTLPTLLWNKNSKTVILSTLVVSLFFVAGSSASSFFPSSSSEAMPEHPNSNIPFHYISTYYSNSMSNGMSSILFLKIDSPYHTLQSIEADMGWALN